MKVLVLCVFAALISCTWSACSGTTSGTNIRRRPTAFPTTNPSRAPGEPLDLFCNQEACLNGEYAAYPITSGASGNAARYVQQVACTNDISAANDPVLGCYGVPQQQVYVGNKKCPRCSCLSTSVGIAPNWVQLSHDKGPTSIAVTCLATTGSNTCGGATQYYMETARTNGGFRYTYLNDQNVFSTAWYRHKPQTCEFNVGTTVYFANDTEVRLWTASSGNAVEYCTVAVCENGNAVPYRTDTAQVVTKNELKFRQLCKAQRADFQYGCLNQPSLWNWRTSGGSNACEGSVSNMCNQFSCGCPVGTVPGNTTWVSETDPVTGTHYCHEIMCTNSTATDVLNGWYLRGVVLQTLSSDVGPVTCPPNEAFNNGGNLVACPAGQNDPVIIDNTVTPLQYGCTYNSTCSSLYSLDPATINKCQEAIYSYDVYPAPGSCLSERYIPSGLPSKAYGAPSSCPTPSPTSFPTCYSPVTTSTGYISYQCFPPTGKDNFVRSQKCAANSILKSAYTNYNRELNSERWNREVNFKWGCRSGGYATRYYLDYHQCDQQRFQNYIKFKSRVACKFVSDLTSGMDTTASLGYNYAKTQQEMDQLSADVGSDLSFLRGYGCDYQVKCNGGNSQVTFYKPVFTFTATIFNTTCDEITADNVVAQVAAPVSGSLASNLYTSGKETTGTSEERGTSTGTNCKVSGKLYFSTKTAGDKYWSDYQNKKYGFDHATTPPTQYLQGSYTSGQGSANEVYTSSSTRVVVPHVFAAIATALFYSLFLLV